MKKFFDLITKPFLGSGITERIPFLRSIYERLNSKLLGNKIITSEITLSLKLSYRSADAGLGTYLRLTGEYEPFQTELMLKESTQGKVFLDIGANVGYYTIIAARKGLKVYSFEPDIDNFELLNQNISQNNLSNLVVTHQKAISDVNLELYFKRDLNQPGNSSLGDEKNFDYKVQGIKLDDFIKENNISPNIIKVDIEGAEVMMLEGAKEFFQKTEDLLVFMEYNYKALMKFVADPQILITKLLDFGFNIQIIDENSKELIEYNKEKLAELVTKYGFTNLLCSKKRG